MVGFSLDPDHHELKQKFFQHYQNDSEFRRVDVFMCSHPVANCELFERFQKPMVVFATTRLEFGRDDQKVSWRRREIAKWRAWGELKGRQRDWISFVIRHYQAGKLAVAANSAYDAEYVRYFTGVPTEYIPSWCGDSDTSYGGKKDWVGCVPVSADVDANTSKGTGTGRYTGGIRTGIYAPTSEKVLIVPYKQKRIMLAKGEHDQQSYKELDDARRIFTLVNNRTASTIVHSRDEVHDHSPASYRAYRALVFIPYQPSVMTFFELYRQNIPIFSPNLDLLVEWHQQFKILTGRIYGTPERHVDLITNLTGLPIDPSIPNPNDDMNITSNYYWFKYSDTLTFPHIVLFDSWTHLFELLDTTNLTDISAKMARYNMKSREKIARKWDQVFRKLVPERKRATIFA
jgi:hypothetical protein